MEEIVRWLMNKNINSDETKTILDLYEYRIVHRDGKDFIVTSDFHPTRMNLKVENNIITNINLG